MLHCFKCKRQSEKIYLDITFNYSKHKLFAGKAEVGYLSSNDMLHKAI